MTNYSEGFKEALVKKALLDPDRSPRRFAKEAGVSNSALYSWIKRYKKVNNGVDGNSNNYCNNWTIEERFNMLIEANSLTEEQRGAYCRRKGIFQHQLLEWKKEFMKSNTETKNVKAQAELRVLRSENKALKKELRRKDRALAETSALLVLKKKSKLALGGGRGRLIDKSQRQEALRLIEEAHRAGARKRKACELLNISIRTLERWLVEDGIEDKRKTAAHTPSNKLTPEERQRIISVSNLPEYCDLPPCKIVPMLADEQIYIASEASFYRVLREEKMLKHRGKSKPKSNSKPKQLVATGPNQVLSWDISYLSSDIAGIFHYLYMVIDIFSRKIVGWTVQAHENSDYASALMEQVCLDENIDPNQATLHSDNGSPMKGATLLFTLQQLGVLTSFSRPAVSNDNPYSESMFKTLKYRPIYPKKGFSSIEEARAWVEEFVNWYNMEHLHSSLKFVTPHQRHTGQDQSILEGRKLVYQKAKFKMPSRWSGGIRNWDLPKEIILNPDKKTTATNSESVREVSNG